jgi:hypothetical protein
LLAPHQHPWVTDRNRLALAQPPASKRLLKRPKPTPPSPPKRAKTPSY